MAVPVPSSLLVTEALKHQSYDQVYEKAQNVVPYMILKPLQKAFSLDCSYIPRKKGMNLNETHALLHVIYRCGRRLGLN